MLCYGAITPELSIMRKTTVEAGWIDLGSGWDPRSLRKTGDGAWASLISEMKNCLLKMGGMIVDFLEEVSDLLGGSSAPFFTSLEGLLPAFRLLSIPRTAVAPSVLGWDGDWVQFSD